MEAREDYFGILRYVADDNPFAAERIVDEIGKAGNGLGEFATGRQGRVTGTYEKVVAGLPYIIAYAITVEGGQESITILRVVHAAQDWPAEAWPTP